MMKWIDSMLADGVNGSVSSKRVVTLAAFLMCSMAFCVDIFTDFKVKQELFDSMMYIVIAGLGFTATEKFSRRKEE